MVNEQNYGHNYCTSGLPGNDCRGVGDFTIRSGESIGCLGWSNRACGLGDSHADTFLTVCVDNHYTHSVVVLISERLKMSYSQIHDYIKGH